MTQRLGDATTAGLAADLTPMGLVAGDVLLAGALVVSNTNRNPALVDIPGAEFSHQNASFPQADSVASVGSLAITGTAPGQIEMTAGLFNQQSEAVLALGFRGVASVAQTLSGSRFGGPILPPPVTVETPGSLVVIAALVGHRLASHSALSAPLDAPRLTTTDKPYSMSLLTGQASPAPGLYTPPEIAAEGPAAVESWIAITWLLTPAEATEPPAQHPIPLTGAALPVGVSGTATPRAVTGHALPHRLEET